jgi:glycosyltransferase involved in cell wall biosynthesis
MYFDVSILVLTYNHENFILQNLISLSEQEFNGNIEVVICNDCSTDKTREIIESFITKIANSNIDFKLFNHPKNIGMQNNFFWGLNKCIGEFVAICDGDDYWIDSNKLEIQVSKFRKNEDIGLIFSNAKWFDDQNKEFVEIPLINRINFKTWHNLDLYIEQGSHFLNSPTFLFRRKLVNIPLQTDLKENTIWDLFIILSILNNGHIVYFLEEITAVYRLLLNSASRNDSRKKQFAFFLKKLNTEVLFLKNKKLKKIIRTKFYNEYFDSIKNVNIFKRLEIVSILFNKKSKLKLFKFLYKPLS